MTVPGVTFLRSLLNHCPLRFCVALWLFLTLFLLLSCFFLAAGDLKAFPAEISDLMVNCFSQLSVQTPIMASMLALIHTHEPEFTALVADKLQTRYLQAVAQDDVVVAKLLLRAVTCLAGALTFAVEGNGGLVEILTPLLTDLTQGTHYFPIGYLCANRTCVLPLFSFPFLLTNSSELAQNTDNTKALRLSESAQAAAYLLSSTLIWAAPVLQSHNQEAFLQSARAALEQIKAQYVSAYALGGLQAVFSAFSPVDEDEEEEGGAVGANRVLSVGESNDFLLLFFDYCCYFCTLSSLLPVSFSLNNMKVLVCTLLLGRAS